ncbi:MAG: mechanosensitive ion channel protein MscL [Thermoleophilia bacterium]|nr:mechanosensitive ion channel protein MscL [Thermoleophilia bacterium]
MITEFRDFLMRGNLLELAVAFVMGLAFATLIGSFVSSFVIPIVDMISGEQDLSGLTFTINDAVFAYGSFVVAVITFVAIAAAVFFFIVKPVDAIMSRMQEPDEEAVSDEERRHQELLAAIKEMSR